MSPLKHPVFGTQERVSSFADAVFGQGDAVIPEESSVVELNDDVSSPKHSMVQVDLQSF